MPQQVLISRIVIKALLVEFIIYDVCFGSVSFIQETNSCNNRLNHSHFASLISLNIYFCYCPLAWCFIILREIPSTKSTLLWEAGVVAVDQIARLVFFSDWG